MTATLDDEVTELRRANAELQQRLDEALTREVATAEVMGVINSSPGDLTPVFESLLETGARLCRAEQAVITLRNSQDGLYHYGTSFGYSDEFKELLAHNPVAPGRASLLGRTALEKRVVHIEDAAVDPDYKWAEALRLGRWSTGLGVPLLRDGSVIGVVALTRRRVERFTDKQIELIKTFADQAVIAIENARLLVELRESDERYGLVNQAVAEGIYEWDIERNSLWVSSRLTEIFGFEGRNLTAADWNKLVHPADFTRYREVLRDCFKAVTPRLDCEYRVRHSDGQYRWVEDRGIPVRDIAGRAVRLVGAVSDISERIAANQALSETNRLKEALLGHLNAVIDAIDYGVLFMDHDLRARVINRAFRQMWGIPDSFIATGPTMADLIDYNRHSGLYDVPEPEFDAFIAGRVNAIQKGRIDPVEMRRADGKILRYQGTVLPDGGRLLTYLDITGSERREAELREALDQQTATAEVLAVINSSPGDLAPVFDAVMEKALRLSGASNGALVTFDGEFFQAVASRGNAAGFNEIVQRPYRPHPVHMPLLQGERYVHIPDVTAAFPDWAGAVVGGFCTILLVPLRKDGRLLGFLAANRREVQAFSDKEIALVESFAAQAVIAMENARLLEELRNRTSDLQESLEYQTATSDVLNVISRSAFDLEPILESVVTTAARLCRAEKAILYRLQDGAYRFAAGHSNEPEYERIERATPIYPGEGTVAGRAALHQRVVQIVDPLADPQYESKEEARIGNARSMIGVPMLRDGVPVGIIALARERVEPFNDRQIELVQTFADQAIIAIENARLITETREALEKQTAMADILRVIAGSPTDVQPTFDVIAASAVRICGAHNGGVLRFDGSLIHLVAHNSWTTVELDAIHRVYPVPPSRQTATARAVLTRNVVHIVDPKLDPDFSQVSLHQFGTTLSVPMLRDGNPLGAITVTRNRVEAFTEAQIDLLNTFADQAVIAIENVRLFNELNERTDELALRQAELRVTFDNMADGVVMFDEDRRLAAWNRNFQELLDLPDAVLADRPSYADYLGILAERGEFGTDDIEAELTRRLEHTDQELRLERTRPDGRVIEVRRNAVSDGGFVLIYSDITERKRSEAEIRAARDAAEAAYRDLKAAQANLVQAEKMASLGQLTAGIAHEIKNPLNFVNNFAGLSVELLEELKEATEPAIAALDKSTRAEVDETMMMLTGNLEKIAEHGKRADNIVKSMLEHSRGVSGERREVDLNQLVEEALNLAYHGARAQDQTFNITLERDFAESLKPIEVAPQEITRVFLNLFGNGFYAANKRLHGNGKREFRPTLSVATRDDGEAVEVRVRDNGTGIPPDIRDKLFQPFFTTKPTGEGTGLGLSISYDIVTQQHSGTITVDSRVGEFTEFTVRLPRR